MSVFETVHRSMHRRRNTMHHTAIVSKRLIPSHSHVTDPHEVNHYWSSLMSLWGVHGRTRTRTRTRTSYSSHETRRIRGGDLFASTLSTHADAMGGSEIICVSHVSAPSLVGTKDTSMYAAVATMAPTVVRA